MPFDDSCFRSRATQLQFEEFEGYEMIGETGWARNGWVKFGAVHTDTCCRGRSHLLILVCWVKIVIPRRLRTFLASSTQ